MLLSDVCLSRTSGLVSNVPTRRHAFTLYTTCQGLMSIQATFFSLFMLSKSGFITGWWCCSRSSFHVYFSSYIHKFVSIYFGKAYLFCLHAWNVNTKVTIVEFSTLNGFKYSISNADLSNHLVPHWCLCIIILLKPCLCVYTFFIYNVYVHLSMYFDSEVGTLFTNIFAGQMLDFCSLSVPSDCFLLCYFFLL